MFKYYKKTHLEDFVEELYIQNNILLPEDITIDKLSKNLKIKVEYVRVESFSLRTNSKLLILLNERISPQKKREDFLHELCHLVRHEGNQIVSSEHFIKYQEDDAVQFQLYSLMPFNMIEQMKLSPDHGQAIKQISHTFSVSIEQARNRYEQILRREFEGAMSAEVSAALEPRKEMKCVTNDEVEFAVYYDPSGTTDGPSQLVVTLDEWTLVNCREITLPIGERLPEIDLEEMQKTQCLAALSGDVICFDGTITLQVHQLLYRHGLNNRCYVIHMNDVGMKIARDQEMMRKLSW